MPPCRRRCPGPAGPVAHSLRPEPPAPHDEPEFSTGCSPWPHPTTALTRPTTTTANFAQSQLPSFSLLKSSPAQPFPHLPASPHPKHSSNCLVQRADIDSTIATLAARCVAGPTDGCDIPYSTYPFVTPHLYGPVWAGCRAQLNRRWCHRTADALVPAANASILACRMPRAQIHRVHGGGHLCLLARAAEVGPIVTAFLRSLERTAINEVAELG